MRRLTLLLGVALVAVAFGAAAPQTASAVTLTVAPSGSGSITADDLVIDCGATCTNSYPYDSFLCSWLSVLCPVTVTLTPHPDLLSYFDHWEGACTGSAATCAVYMDGDKSVTAVFGFWFFPPIFVFRYVTVNEPGTGVGTVTSSPGGIDCGATCTYGFWDPTTVTLYATPAVGSVFTSWGGACTGTPASLPCVVTATGGDLSVDAVFTAVPTHTLAVAKGGSGTGTVASTPLGINCGATCSASFASGTGVTLAAVADAGSVFAGWSGACSGTTLTCNLTMSAAMSVGATFSSAGGGGACTITGTAAGETLTGTPGDDVICGLGGNDTIFGLGGDDVLIGATGGDQIYGGAGSDELRGGRGADTLNGGAGPDTLKGGSGNDGLQGGAGPDLLLGGTGWDTGNGGGGSDTCSGVEIATSCP